MGLSPQSTPSTTGLQNTPFWQTLLDGNQFSNPEFSIYQARNEQLGPSLAKTNPGGSITFGGRNATLFQGDIEFQDFPSGVNNTYWCQNITCKPIV